MTAGVVALGLIIGLPFLCCCKNENDPGHHLEPKGLTNGPKSGKQKGQQEGNTENHFDTGKKPRFFENNFENNPEKFSHADSPQPTQGLSSDMRIAPRKFADDAAAEAFKMANFRFSAEELAGFRAGLLNVFAAHQDVVARHF